MSAICALAALAAAVAGSDEPTKIRARIRAIEPADSALIPEARRLLEYLQAVRGQGMLTGVSRVGGGPEPVLHGTGREPAIRHLQSAFFPVPNLAAPTVETARQWWHEKGGVVQFHFHWNTFNHDVFITLDRLPVLKDGNVMPNVRLTHPVEGAEAQGRQLHIFGVATERNNNLKTVTVHALTGPWLDWIQRKDFEAVRAAFGDATRLGKAELQPNGQWSFTWQDPPAGYHNLIAFARDAEGAVAYSNAARITTGLQNMARGKKATASSVSPHGGPPEDAVDSDPFSMWWSDNRQDDPQWLMVDLGVEKRVGAVGVSWWKAHATHYTVQASSDGQDWRAVARIEGRRAPQGDSDLIRLDPVPARYLRLHCTKRAVTWQAYCVGEFAAYERLPEHK